MVAPDGVVNPYAASTTRRPNASTTNSARAAYRTARELLAEEEQAMQIADEAMVIEGGRSILRHSARNIVRNVIIASIETFLSRVSEVERKKRVNKVAKQSASINKAERIAAVLAKEHKAERVVLNGLINEQATAAFQAVRKNDPDSTEALRRQMQSMQAQLENNKKTIANLSKNVMGGSATKPPRGNGNHRGAGGRAAAPNATSQSHQSLAGRGAAGSRRASAGRGTPTGRGGRSGGTGGRGNASTAASARRHGGRSSSNSNGKRRGPPTSSRK